MSETGDRLRKTGDPRAFAQNCGFRVTCRDSAIVAVQLLAGEGDGQDVKAGDTVKVPEIGCPDAPSGRDGGSRDKPVVGADVLADGGEFGPDAGVRTSGQEAEGQRRERGEYSLDEGLTAGPVLRARAVHAMEQLGGCYGCDPDLLIRL